MLNQDLLNRVVAEKGWQKLDLSDPQWSHLAKPRLGAWVQRPDTKIGYLVIADWTKASHETLVFHLAQAAGYETPFTLTEKLSRGRYLFFSEAVHPFVQTLQQIGKDATPEIIAIAADTISSYLPFDLLVANADLHDEHVVIAKPASTGIQPETFGYRIDYGYPLESEHITTRWILEQWCSNFAFMVEEHPIKLNPVKIGEGVQKVQGLSDAALETCIKKTAALDPERFSEAKQVHSLQAMIKRRSEIRRACRSKILTKHFG